MTLPTSRELQEFHPVTLLNTTHKITSITANFMGINKLSQSILPLFLPAIPGSLHVSCCPAFSQEENNGGFPPQLREGFTRARPGRRGL